MMRIQRKPLLTWQRALAVSLPMLLAQVLSPVLPGVTLQSAYAQEEKKEERETRRTAAMNNKVYEALQEAQKFAEEKQYAEALKVLDDLRKARELNGYELANLFNLYGFVYYSQENLDKALESYKSVIIQPDIPEGLLIATRYTIAQLYFIQENWREGIKELLEWFKVTTNPGAEAYNLLATAYYQLGDQPNALINIEKAINLYKQDGKIPKENWYGLQRFLYYEKDDFKKVAAILEEMLKHYPKITYWTQLSAMYGELKQDGKQLYAMEMAYTQGGLEKEGDLVRMAYLYLANEIPYKAAKVLDKGIKEKKIEPTSKNLELLANSWRQAQEVKKSIPEMVRAAEKSDDGELWTRLGSIYLDNEEFKKAADAVNSGLKKGGVKRPDQANLVLGMAYFNLDDYSNARKAFNEAKKDKRSKEYAEQWLGFMEREIERQASLRDV